MAILQFAMRNPWLFDAPSTTHFVERLLNDGIELSVGLIANARQKSGGRSRIRIIVSRITLPHAGIDLLVLEEGAHFEIHDNRNPVLDGRPHVCAQKVTEAWMEGKLRGGMTPLAQMVAR